MLAIGVAASVLLAAGGLALLNTTPPQMGYLFTELDAANAKNITDKLTASGVPWQLSPDGASIMAPADQIAALRMQLAGDMVTGKIGYEVIDAENPLGMSDQRAKLNQIRAIEGELAKSIMTIDAVERARVHLSVPERALFAREPRPASAAVTIKSRGQIQKETVTAIQTLVAASVADLAPENVSIVDQYGRLLSGSRDGSAAIDDRQSQIETKLQTEVETLLERAAGPGRVRVTVAAELSRATRRDETQSYDPEGQVIARETSVEALGNSRENDNARTATIANDLPENAGEPLEGGITELRSSENREISSEVAYNNSVKHSTLVEGAGALQRLTVSVLVDPKTASGRDLTAADVEQMTRLVQGAVGYSQARGDVVTIELMPMVIPEDMVEEAPTMMPSGLPSWSLPAFLGLVVLMGIGAYLYLRRRKQRAANAVAAQEAQEAEAQLIEVDAAQGDQAAQLALADGTQEPQPLSVSSGMPSLPPLQEMGQADRERMEAMIQKAKKLAVENPRVAAAIISRYLAS